MAPDIESNDIKRIQDLLPAVEPGEGRTLAMQAVFQLIGLCATLLFALITGCLTGKSKITAPNINPKLV